jgi:DNA-binding PadR family transcriptional regulator
MSLAYAILSILIHQECCGYDIAKQFDNSIGYLWSATHQQIYRELNQLEEKEWVRGYIVEQIDRPNKRLFILTSLGQQKMMEWMTQPSKESRCKEEILVKLFAGSLMEAHQWIVELTRARAVHQQKLQLYQKIVTSQYCPNPTELSFKDKCHYLALRQGISYETHWIDWCNEALKVLSPA